MRPRPPGIRQEAVRTEQVRPYLIAWLKRWEVAHPRQDSWKSCDEVDDSVVAGFTQPLTGVQAIQSRTNMMLTERWLRRVRDGLSDYLDFVHVDMLLTAIGEQHRLLNGEIQIEKWTTNTRVNEISSNGVVARRAEEHQLKVRIIKECDGACDAAAVRLYKEYGIEITYESLVAIGNKAGVKCYTGEASAAKKRKTYTAKSFARKKSARRYAPGSSDPKAPDISWLRIYALKDAGFGYKSIAKTVGCSVGKVRWALARRNV